MKRLLNLRLKLKEFFKRAKMQMKLFYNKAQYVAGSSFVMVEHKT